MRGDLLLGSCLLVLAAASACSSRRGEPLVGPMPAVDPEAARGHALYDRFCGPCHPGGEGGLGPALNDKVIAPRFLVRTQVRLGLGAMPSFDEATLPDEDLDAIVDWVMALRSHGG